MNFKSAVLLLGFVAVAAATDLVPKMKGVPTITICSGPGAWLSDVTYTYSPANIQPGSMLNVTVSGQLSQEVTSATLMLNVAFDGIPIISKKESVCHLKSNPFPCPVQPGPLSYSIQHEIPNVPIGGLVQAKAVLTSQTGAQIVCAKVSVNI